MMRVLDSALEDEYLVAGIEVLHRKQSAVAGVSATLPSNFTRPLNNHLFHLLPPSFLQ